MKQRITISLDEDQAAKFDQLIAERGYENRSEAFRDLIRAAEASQTLSDPSTTITKDSSPCASLRSSMNTAIWSSARCMRTSDMRTAWRRFFLRALWQKFGLLQTN